MPMQRRPVRNGRLQRERGGVVLLAVLGVMLIAGMILMAWLKQSVQQQQIVRRQAITLQTQWLAESALARAVARLAADPNYRNETWDISADDLDGHGSARIDIVIDVDENDAVSGVSVAAQYPLDCLELVTCRKRVSIEK